MLPASQHKKSYPTELLHPLHYALYTDDAETLKSTIANLLADFYGREKLVGKDEREKKELLEKSDSAWKQLVQDFMGKKYTLPQHHRVHITSTGDQYIDRRWFLDKVVVVTPFGSDSEVLPEQESRLARLENLTSSIASSGETALPPMSIAVIRRNKETLQFLLDNVFPIVLRDTTSSASYRENTIESALVHAFQLDFVEGVEMVLAKWPHEELKKPVSTRVAVDLLLTGAKYGLKSTLPLLKYVLHRMFRHNDKEYANVGGVVKSLPRMFVENITEDAGYTNTRVAEDNDTVVLSIRADSQLISRCDKQRLAVLQGVITALVNACPGNHLRKELQKSVKEYLLPDTGVLWADTRVGVTSGTLLARFHASYVAFTRGDRANVNLQLFNYFRKLLHNGTLEETQRGLAFFDIISESSPEFLLTNSLQPMVEIFRDTVHSFALMVPAKLAMLKKCGLPEAELQKLHFFVSWAVDGFDTVEIGSFPRTKMLRENAAELLDMMGRIIFGFPSNGLSAADMKFFELRLALQYLAGHRVSQISEYTRKGEIHILSEIFERESYKDSVMKQNFAPKTSEIARVPLQFLDRFEKLRQVVRGRRDVFRILRASEEAGRTRVHARMKKEG